MQPPGSDDLAGFVTRLQRLLTEGEFVSTYKYALLVALARWAVENSDYDQSKELDVAALAPHFVELYWPQAQPFATEPAQQVAEYPTTGWAGVLIQDRGQRSEQQMPRILKKIREASSECGGAWWRLPTESRHGLFAEGRRSIADMPLWKLHRVRSSGEPMTFLYRKGSNGYRLVFEPGVVACLAHFAPLIEETVRAAWMRHVLRCNSGLLGATSQVEDFLFPESRRGLSAWARPLREVQGDRCFYCDGAMRDRFEVDHFLPWTRYRRDLGHNFVLAHPACNNSKRDLLASCEHLERWNERNQTVGAELASAFDTEQLPHDWPTLRRVAGSLYQLAEAEGAEVWQARSHLIPLTPDWRHILGVA